MGSNRDDQSWDFSFYKSRSPARNRRRSITNASGNESGRPPRPITSLLQVEGGLKGSIVRLLSREPYLSVDDVFNRFDFGNITVSRTTVSAIISEFRRARRRATEGPAS